MIELHEVRGTSTEIYLLSIYPPWYLVQGCQFVFCTFGIVNIIETRDILHVLSSLSLDNRLLTTSDRRKISLSFNHSLSNTPAVISMSLLEILMEFPSKLRIGEFSCRFCHFPKDAYTSGCLYHHPFLGNSGTSVEGTLIS